MHAMMFAGTTKSIFPARRASCATTRLIMGHTKFHPWARCSVASGVKPLRTKSAAFSGVMHLLTTTLRYRSGGRSYVDDPELQWAACETLFNLADASPTNAAALVAAGAVERVAAALAAHTRRGGIVARGCKALGALTLHTDPRLAKGTACIAAQDRIREAGGITALVRALDNPDGLRRHRAIAQCALPALGKATRSLCAALSAAPGAPPFPDGCSAWEARPRSLWN